MPQRHLSTLTGTAKIAPWTTGTTIMNIGSASVRRAFARSTVNLIHMTLAPAMRRRHFPFPRPDCQRGAGFDELPETGSIHTMR